MVQKQEFTKYEKARILGARGLQISMDAPLLIKIKKEELNNINYDPLIIAEKELEEGVLPITIKKPLPPKGKVEEIKKIKIEETNISDEKKIKEEQEGEKEIAESNDMIERTGEESEEETSISPNPLEEKTNNLD